MWGGQRGLPGGGGLQGSPLLGGAQGLLQGHGVGRALGQSSVHVASPSSALTASRSSDSTGSDESYRPRPRSYTYQALVSVDPPKNAVTVCDSHPISQLSTLRLGEASGLSTLTEPGLGAGLLCGPACLQP